MWTSSFRVTLQIKMVGLRIVVSMLCAAQFIRTGSSQGLFQAFTQQQESFRCRLGRGIAGLLRSEKLMACVSCADESHCSYEITLPALWEASIQVLTERLSWLCVSACDAVRGLGEIRWGAAALELMMVVALFCGLLYIFMPWKRRSDDKFYDAFSLQTYTTKHRRSPDNFKSLESLSAKPVMSDGDCRAAPDHATGQRDSGLLTKTHAECGGNHCKKPRMVVTNESQQRESKQNAKSNLRETRWPSMVRMTNTSGSPVHQGLRASRPSPPTVRVYSLHKPNEIPGDVMDALLCLKKDCEHDHSRIRLIGPKVVVYSIVKPKQTKQTEARKEPTQMNSSEIDEQSLWRGGEPTPIVEECVLSREEPLVYDDTSHVSTQTEALEPPTTLVIRTEAYMARESRTGNLQTFPKGSMTGTLLIAKDSFETKIFRRTWSQANSGEGSLRASVSQVTCSNVRENIARSRLEIADLDSQLGSLKLDVGHPQANSTTNDEVLSNNTANAADCTLNTTFTSTTRSSLNPVNDSFICSRTAKSETSALTPGKSKTLSPTPSGRQSWSAPHHRRTATPRRSSLVELSRSMPYMGSDTAFYEKLSLLLAEYAMYKYSQAVRRSSTEARGIRRAPPGLSRTI